MSQRGEHAIESVERARPRLARIYPALALAIAFVSCRGPVLEPWHTEPLDDEFTVDHLDEVRTLADYLQLEDALFEQLQREVYDRVETGEGQELVRYSAGSAADPTDDVPNWNRSFELVPDEAIGGVLLLHGMSDSPYSLRALGQNLERAGYRVLGLRLPGHGTAPSGLVHVKAEDMSAATRLGMLHLGSALGSRPIHVIGYSTGATLALEYALDAAAGVVEPTPASLVMISPAIRIHGAAALASFKDDLSVLPGLDGFAWLQVVPEFDPYKYNSFATNAGDVVHRLTRRATSRVRALSGNDGSKKLPPILVFKSTVDATVTTSAVVDRLLGRLPSERNELVLFDINRFAARSPLLIQDPAPLTNRLLADEGLPFAVTFVTNESKNTRRVVVRRKEPFSDEAVVTERLALTWPTGVMSLSHVALPIPPDDPLYGERRPESEDVLFLGDMALKGERGLLELPSEWLLRMRYNPFYDLLERRIVGWMSDAEDPASEAE